MKSTFSRNFGPAKRQRRDTGSASSQMREDVDLSARPPIVRERWPDGVTGEMMSNKYLLAAVLAAAALAMYASVFMKVAGE